MFSVANAAERKAFGVALHRWHVVQLQQDMGAVPTAAAESDAARLNSDPNVGPGYGCVHRWLENLDTRALPGMCTRGQYHQDGSNE
jgi:hypothetical protein